MILGVDVSTYLEELSHGAKYYDGDKEIEAECEEDSIEEDTDDDDLDYRAGDFAENG